MITDIISQLKRDEGFVNHIYTDSVGKKTIGYGHNLIAKPLQLPPIPVSEVWATNVLVQDVMDAQNALIIKLPWVDRLDQARAGVLENMAFNMGINRLLEFIHFLAYVENGDYKLASFEMLNSLWAREVHQRAARLSNQMLTGEWT